MIKDALELRFPLEGMIELLDKMYDGFLLTSLDGRIFYANQAVERISGFSLHSIVGKTVEEMKKDGVIVECSAVVKPSSPTTMIQKLGNGKEIFIISKPIYDIHGTITCFAVNYHELSSLDEMHQNHLNEVSNNQYKQEFDLDSDFESWIGDSHQTKKLKTKIKKIAKTEAILLLLGESGVGKEVIASHVHKLSHRRDKAYIQINCGAIPADLIEAELFGYEKGAFTGAHQLKKGLLEMADGGTVLLDEIGEMPPSLQVKLLRVIQTQKITRIGGTKEISLNLRFIAATNRDLKKEVELGNFREDLYYRLNVIPISIPALRERKEDIILLTVYFLKKYNRKYNFQKVFTPESLQMIQDYEWPGNVRQLENMIERLVVITESNMISPYDLPKEFNIRREIGAEEIKPLQKVREEAEFRMIQLALSKYSTVREAAKHLKVDHSTIVRKMQKYTMQNDMVY